MSTVVLQTALRTSAPRLAEPIGRAFASLFMTVKRWVTPRPATTVEAVASLRQAADDYSARGLHGLAAELRAAADRHEQLQGQH